MPYEYRMTSAKIRCCYLLIAELSFPFYSGIRRVACARTQKKTRVVRAMDREAASKLVSLRLKQASEINSRVSIRIEAVTALALFLLPSKVIFPAYRRTKKASDCRMAIGMTANNGVRGRYALSKQRASLCMRLVGCLNWWVVVCLLFSLRLVDVFTAFGCNRSCLSNPNKNCSPVYAGSFTN
jgi:hypothetical protein